SRSRGLVDVIVNHDFERLRYEVKRVGRMDVGRGLFDVPIEGLPPVKADRLGPREAACHLTNPRHLVVPSCGNDHLTDREVIGTLNVALADCEIAESAKPLD